MREKETSEKVAARAFAQVSLRAEYSVGDLLSRGGRSLSCTGLPQ